MARWRPWKTIRLKCVFEASRKSSRETKELVFSEPIKLPAMRMAFDFLAKRSIFSGQVLTSVRSLGSGLQRLEVMEQFVWRPLTFHHVWCRLWLLFISPVALRTLKTASPKLDLPGWWCILTPNERSPLPGHRVSLSTSTLLRLCVQHIILSSYPQVTRADPACSPDIVWLSPSCSCW